MPVAELVARTDSSFELMSLTRVCSVEGQKHCMLLDELKGREGHNLMDAM